MYTEQYKHANKDYTDATRRDDAERLPKTLILKPQLAFIKQTIQCFKNCLKTELLSLVKLHRNLQYVLSSEGRLR